MAGDQPALTRAQQRLLQTVYNRFRELCNWPKFGDIDRLLAGGRRPLDAAVLLKQMPEDLIDGLGDNAPAYSTDVPLKLSLDAVALCENAASRYRTSCWRSWRMAPDWTRNSALPPSVPTG